MSSGCLLKERKLIVKRPINVLMGNCTQANRGVQIMSANKISEQLEAIAAAEDFPEQIAELVEQWRNTAEDNLETVEAILRFMERYPEIDFGTPGALVHFVERFYGKGYEAKLLDSVGRRPTAHTVMILNAVINGTHMPEVKRHLITALKQAGESPLADSDTQYFVGQFLQRLSAT